MRILTNGRYYHGHEEILSRVHEIEAEYAGLDMPEEARQELTWLRDALKKDVAQRAILRER